MRQREFLHTTFAVYYSPPHLVNIVLATVKLFKAVEISNKRKKGTPSDKLLEKTIAQGFVFAPEVLGNYSEGELLELVGEIGKQYRLSGKELNASFHKSWKKVRDASIEQLVIEQIVHYFTTYGFEALGIYDKDSVYIPKEKLRVPLEDGLELIVIHGYTKTELKDKALGLLGSGIALAKDTLEDLFVVCESVGFGAEDINKVKNREFRIMLYDRQGIVPRDPVEFLRYVIFKITGETLLIKNDGLIKKVEDSMNASHTILFLRYKESYGLEGLAQVFHRFKPIFLAFKHDEQMCRIINKINKLARTHHVPMKRDFLNDVTANISGGISLTKKQLTDALDKVNIFRKVRLAYALQFRTSPQTSIVYQVRNGKGYATSFDFSNHEEAVRVFDIVMDSVSKDVEKRVKSKRIYIPENVHYALPSSEKQFIGNLPFGTFVTVPQGMMVGVHWTNVEHHRIDLDLSMISLHLKFGWDGAYRSGARDILFSGDMTDAPAPKGASETYYVSDDIDEPMMTCLNYFNFDEDIPVPFKLFVAHENAKELERNYTVDPNNVLVSTPIMMTQKQQILGLLMKMDQELRFYFTSVSIGKAISSSHNKYTNHARTYYMNRFTRPIELKEVLERAGAKFVSSPDKADIDLSPLKLEKDTIIKLLIGDTHAKK